MLRQPRHLLSAAIAIVLGVAFVAATLILGASMDEGVRQMAAGQVNGAAVVITGQDQPVPAELADRAAALPGVTGSRKIVDGVGQALVDGAPSTVSVQSQPASSATTRLVDGHWANAPDEVTVNESARDRDATHIAMGSTIGFTMPQGRTQRYTVVGVAQLGYEAAGSPNSPIVMADATTAMAITGVQGYSRVYLDSRADAVQLRDQVEQLAGASGDGLTIRTGPDETNFLVKQLAGGSNALQALLLGFAAIALFVGAIVITNTFAILVTQRIRQLALLRCVGATRNQVFRLVIGEALALAAAGSVVGVGLGIGLAAVFVDLMKRSVSGPLPFTISLPSVLVPLLVGVIVTTIAALAPARAATRVSPLAALRPELAPSASASVRLRRIVPGVVALAVGAAMLTWGATREPPQATTGLAVAMAGGALSFVGVLVVNRILIPTLVGLLAQPTKAAGVASELAVGNARRNPRRTAATANALLVGVTLISLLSVGAATAQASADRTLVAHYPQDAVVSTPQGADDTLLSRVRSTEGVSDAALVATVTAHVRHDGTDADTTVTAVSPQAARTTRFPERYSGLADNTARTKDKAFRDGQQITLSSAGHDVTLVVRVSDDSSDGLVVSPSVMSRLDPRASQQIWVRYVEGADVDQVTADLGRAISSVPGAQVDSGAQIRQIFQQVVDILLAVAIGLLGVAVLIAVVGVANTLGLSVLERTQEIGLLRATGMTRLQVRAMIGWEAVSVSAIALVLGLALGTAYGLVGATCLVQMSGTPVVVNLPWARLAFIAAVALAAGWIASLAPSARAVRISPSAALSTE